MYFSRRPLTQNRGKAVIPPPPHPIDGRETYEERLLSLYTQVSLPPRKRLVGLSWKNRYYVPKIKKKIPKKRSGGRRADRHRRHGSTWSRGNRCRMTNVRESGDGCTRPKRLTHTTKYLHARIRVCTFIISCVCIILYVNRCISRVKAVLYRMICRRARPTMTTAMIVIIIIIAGADGKLPTGIRVFRLCRIGGFAGRLINRNRWLLYSAVPRPVLRRQRRQYSRPTPPSRAPPTADRHQPLRTVSATEGSAEWLLIYCAIIMSAK